MHTTYLVELRPLAKGSDRETFWRGGSFLVGLFISLPIFRNILRLLSSPTVLVSS